LNSLAVRSHFLSSKLGSDVWVASI
jgi:hypothetical protein